MKVKFERIVIDSRWKLKRWQRHGDRVLFGWSIFTFSPYEYEHRFNAFGFCIRVWLKKEYNA